MNTKGRGKLRPFLLAAPGGNADGRDPRTGPNTVRVESDYARLPEGDVVFLFDRSKQPPSLHVTIDDASWSSMKE